MTGTNLGDQNEFAPHPQNEILFLDNHPHHFYVGVLDLHVAPGVMNVPISKALHQ